MCKYTANLDQFNRFAVYKQGFSYSGLVHSGNMKHVLVMHATQRLNTSIESISIPVLHPTCQIYHVHGFVANILFRDISRHLLLTKLKSHAHKCNTRDNSVSVKILAQGGA